MSSRPGDPGSASGMVMSNYQLGEALGKGASAQVYKALNWTTGETVAIKKISLSDIPKAELGDIMSEIDLLKNLNNENIVKYKGFFKTSEFLYIILEYCENGSLQYILKRYGKFPEDLVAVYISQVLQGLIYLHSQGVIHRDIKGANILTNKDGSVKLADFGVATMMPGLVGDANAGGGDDSVVGSPYWMAPEVIEQNGATPSSDIWSVGCVVIELLEGQPPYHSLEPMQALFRIVQDDCPPIPDGASGMVKDFLYQCFQKDPNLRISAKKLAKHPWMMAAQRQSEFSRPVSVPQTVSSAGQTSTVGSETIRAGPIGAGQNRISSGDKTKSKLIITKRKNSGQALLPPGQENRIEAGRNVSGQSFKTEATGSGGSGSGRKAINDMKRRPLTTVYNDAIQRVQDWNEALQSVPKASPRVLRRVQNTLDNQNKPKPSKPAEMAESSSGESLAAHLASVGRKPNGIWIRPLNKDIEELKESSGSEKEGSVWDDDFDEAPDLKRFEKARVVSKPGQDEPDNMKTIKPARSPLNSPPEISRPFPSLTRSVAANYTLNANEDSSEDYSDLAPSDDLELGEKVQRFKLNGLKPHTIYRPEDISALSLRGTPGPSRSDSSRGPSGGYFERPRLPSSGSAGSISSKSPSRSASFRISSAAEAEHFEATEKELKKYAEEEDEGYDDVFAAGDATKHLIVQSNSELLKLGTRRSDRSDVEDEDFDPFADIEDSYSMMDVESNLMRDKHAMLCSNLNDLIEQLQPASAEEILRTASTDLLGILDGAPGLQDYFVATHGMLAVLEVLESAPGRDVVLNLLKMINLMIATEPGVLENLCLIGAIPVIKTFTGRRYSLQTRLEAATFVGSLTNSALTLQMFISCRGLRVLVELLDEDYSSNRDLVLSALRGVASVFDLQTPTPKNDFCRMFIREGIVEPLGTALLHILKDDIEEMDQSKTQIVGIVLMFCQTAQADSRMREALGTRSFVKRLLRACSSLSSPWLATTVKAVKHLSTSPPLLDVLQNADAIAVLVKVLDENLARSGTNEICSHVFQTVFNLCRLSRTRQEEAATNGIIPLLQRALKSNSPMKEFALPILCDMVNAGKTARRQLWKYGGVQVYLDLLPDTYWKVAALEAIVFWLQDETARVEDELLEKSSIDSLRFAFTKAQGTSFEGILEPFLKLLRASPQITIALSQAQVFKRIVDGLHKKAKPITKLNLLRIIKVTSEHYPQHENLADRFGLSKIVEELGRQDEAVLVRQLAKEIAPALLPKSGSIKGSVNEATPRQVVRRSASALDPKPVDRSDHQKHKRKISRNQLSNIHWTEEGGKITPVLGRPSRPPSTPAKGVLRATATTKQEGPSK